MNGNNLTFEKEMILKRETLHNTLYEWPVGRECLNIMFPMKQIYSKNWELRTRII